MKKENKKQEMDSRRGVVMPGSCLVFLRKWAFSHSIGTLFLAFDCARVDRYSARHFEEPNLHTPFQSGRKLNVSKIDGRPRH